MSFENTAKDFNDKSSHLNELLIKTKKQCVSRGALGEFSKLVTDAFNTTT